MSSYNKVNLVGNLACEPELRCTPTGIYVCEFSVAVESVRMDEGEPVGSADYFPVRVWGKLGRDCDDRLRKGSLVHLEGHLKVQRWVDSKTRKNHARIVIVAGQVLFLARLRKAQVAPPCVFAGTLPFRDLPEARPGEAC